MSILKSLLKTFIYEAALQSLFRNLPQAYPMGLMRGELIRGRDIRVGMTIGCITEDMSKSVGFFFHFYNCVVESMSETRVYFRYSLATSHGNLDEKEERDDDGPGDTYAHLDSEFVTFVV